MQEAYQKYCRNLSFPISEEIHDTTLSLPISYATTEKEVEKVIKTINNYL
jgi:dTDP-4-amino-4,6-dideoxygalactose transaminase